MEFDRDLAAAEFDRDLAASEPDRDLDLDPTDCDLDLAGEDDRLLGEPECDLESFWPFVGDLDLDFIEGERDLDAAFDSRPFDAILPTEPDLGDRDLDFLGLSFIL